MPQEGSDRGHVDATVHQLCCYRVAKAAWSKVPGLSHVQVVVLAREAARGLHALGSPCISPTESDAVVLAALVRHLHESNRALLSPVADDPARPGEAE